MAMTASVEAALRPLPAGYHRLYARVVAAAERDERIRMMWLSGSVGRGVADAGSDLDIVVAIAPESVAAFAADWRAWLAEITDTVLARPLPRLPGSFSSVTTECLRLDVVAEQAGAADADSLARRLLVLDKDGAASVSPRRAEGGQPPETGQRAESGQPAPAGPDPVRLADLTAEFFRQMTIFPAAVVARGDWLLGVVGVQGAQLLLYELFVEANQPLPPMGVKQWSAKLTPGQADICAGLPAPTAAEESVVAAMRATATTFRAAASQILAANDVVWPAEFERAVQRFWAEELGRPW
jgi:predicted nucleotidyltransferase